MSLHPASSRPMPSVDQQTMRYLLSFLACCMLPGCLEMEQTVTIGADGGGRQVVKFAMPESTLALVQKASAAAQLGAAANPTAVFDKDLVARELSEAGLGLAKHEAKQVPGKRSVELEATFKDFATLQKSPLCGSTAEWVLAAGPREGTAKLTLYPQGKAAWVDARAKAETMQKETDPITADFFRKRKESLTGLDVVVRLQLPGDVLVWTKNLEKTGDREVTAHITAAQIKSPEDLVRWLAPRFEVIFDAMGCKLPLQ
jgi:hypothetical protein